jgi:nucleoside-diphosphate-sugar epimerase
MAGIDRIQREIGYRVTVPFEEGIDRTVRWYQDVGLKALR